MTLCITNHSTLQDAMIHILKVARHKTKSMELTNDGDIFDAIEFGDLESVKRYWTDSIEIDYQEKGGNTMLMLASFYGFEDIFEFLLSKRPNLNSKNAQGQTASDIARDKGHNSMLDLLRKSR